MEEDLVVGAGAATEGVVAMGSMVVVVVRVILQNIND
jgi:hypothetical protein